MVSIARKNLFAEKMRFTMSVSGVGFSVFLITLLLSLFRGWNDRVGSFVEHVPVDIWVAREGTNDFLRPISVLPQDTADELRALEGVDSVNPLVVVPTGFEWDGKTVETHLVGYDTTTGAGGPLEIVDGKPVPGEGELVVDKALSKTLGPGIGDVLDHSGRTFEVVGLSSGGNFVATQVSFMPIESARSLLGVEGLTTFYLVTLDDPQDAVAVGERIEQNLTGVSAFTGDDFANATRDRTLRDIIPILIIILILAFVVGAAVTGLMIYTATVEKAREFGILRAVGFSNGYLYRVVIEQSLITGLVGFIGGVALNVVVGRFAEDLVPQFVILVRWTDVGAVLGVTLAMSALAALLPVRRLAGIDPVAVFKA